MQLQVTTKRLPWPQPDPQKPLVIRCVHRGQGDFTLLWSAFQHSIKQHTQAHYPFHSLHNAQVQKYVDFFSSGFWCQKLLLWPVSKYIFSISHLRQKVLGSVMVLLPCMKPPCFKPVPTETTACVAEPLFLRQKLTAHSPRRTVSCKLHPWEDIMDFPL